MPKIFLFQVFALSSLGDHLYFRSDVTSKELVGRTWKIVHFNRTKMRSRNYSSLESVTSEGSPVESCRGKERLYWIV